MDLVKPQQPSPQKKELKKDISPSCKVELMKLMKEADVGEWRTCQIQYPNDKYGVGKAKNFLALFSTVFPSLPLLKVL